MAKKDFSSINNAPVYEQINQATKAARKPVEAYNTEQADAMRAAGTTQGRKGCKLHRVNMAFSDEVHDYIRTMARVRGESITEFTNFVFQKSMEDNAETYEKAKAFRDAMKG